MKHSNWNGFKNGVWQDEINVRDFIQSNYKQYTGDDRFLAKATKRTDELMKKLNALFALERHLGGVLDIDTETVASLCNFAPGYLDKEMRSSSVCRRISRSSAPSTRSAASI